MLFICQVWVNVDNLLLIKIHILENHSLKPYFGLMHLIFLEGWSIYFLFLYVVVCVEF